MSEVEIRIVCSEELRNRFKSFAAAMGYDYERALGYLLDRFGWTPRPLVSKVVGEEGVKKVQTEPALERAEFRVKIARP